MVSQKVSRFGRSLLFSLFAIAGGGFAAVSLASVTAAPAAAALGCEHDSCARTCTLGTCGGECFDNPGSNRGCAKDGNDCSGYSCDGPGPIG